MPRRGAAEEGGVPVPGLITLQLRAQRAAEAEARAAGNQDEHSEDVASEASYQATDSLSGSTQYGPSPPRSPAPPIDADEEILTISGARGGSTLVVTRTVEYDEHGNPSTTERFPVKFHETDPKDPCHEFKATGGFYYGVHFMGSTICNMKLNNCILINVRFEKGLFENITWTDVYLKDVTLTDCEFSHSTWTGAKKVGRKDDNPKITIISKDQVMSGEVPREVHDPAFMEFQQRMRGFPGRDMSRFGMDGARDNGRNVNAFQATEDVDDSQSDETIQNQEPEIVDNSQRGTTIEDQEPEVLEDPQRGTTFEDQEQKDVDNSQPNATIENQGLEVVDSSQRGTAIEDQKSEVAGDSQRDTTSEPQELAGTSSTTRTGQQNIIGHGALPPPHLRKHVRNRQQERLSPSNAPAHSYFTRAHSGQEGPSSHSAMSAVHLAPSPMSQTQYSVKPSSRGQGFQSSPMPHRTKPKQSGHKPSFPPMPVHHKAAPEAIVTEEEAKKDQRYNAGSHLSALQQLSGQNAWDSVPTAKSKSMGSYQDVPGQEQDQDLFVAPSASTAKDPTTMLKHPRSMTADTSQGKQSRNRFERKYGAASPKERPKGRVFEDFDFLDMDPGPSGPCGSGNYGSPASFTAQYGNSPVKRSVDQDSSPKDFGDLSGAPVQGCVPSAYAHRDSVSPVYNSTSKNHFTGSPEAADRSKTSFVGPLEAPDPSNISSNTLRRGSIPLVRDFAEDPLPVIGADPLNTKPLNNKPLTGRKASKFWQSIDNLKVPRGGSAKVSGHGSASDSNAQSGRLSPVQESTADTTAVDTPGPSGEANASGPTATSDNEAAIGRKGRKFCKPIEKCFVRAGVSKQEIAKKRTRGRDK